MLARLLSRPPKFALSAPIQDAKSLSFRWLQTTDLGPKLRYEPLSLADIHSSG